MTTEADKITAELMALADAFADEFACGERAPAALPKEIRRAAMARVALEQAIRRAVDWEQVGVTLYNPPTLEYGVKWSTTKPLLHGTPLYARSTKP